jgi:uncharacterized membrane protein
MQLLKGYKRELLLTLVGLTALDLLLWLFKTQAALFLAVFLLFPLWFVYILRFVENTAEKKE